MQFFSLKWLRSSQRRSHLKIQVGNNGIAMALSGDSHQPACSYFDYATYSDTKDLQPLLKSMIKKSHTKRKISATLLLHPSNYQVFTIDEPNVPSSDTRNLARLTVSEKINYPVDEATVDYLPCSYPNPLNQNKQIIVVTAHTPWLLQLKDLCLNLRCELKAISTPEAAYVNLLNNVYAKTGGCGLILQLAYNARIILAHDRQWVMQGILPLLPDNPSPDQMNTFNAGLGRMLNQYNQAFPKSDADTIPLYVTPLDDVVMTHMKTSSSNPINRIELNNIIAKRDTVPPIFYQQGLAVIGETLRDR